ncbi:MAG: ACT domain-containing protein [Pontiellaceae bacterium]|nr:ACT domain-containing protein [Pontiellaceae bacterium]MBN2783298.1 ACT domain-containing protein [Pontiellaceae bacterium]
MPFEEKEVIDVMTATHCKEISVRVLNDIGILAQLTRIVADKGINIRAAAAWVEDGTKGTVRLITDDNLRALEALREHGYIPMEIDSIAVTLRHSPGMLSSVCERMGSSGINMKYMYTTAPIPEETCLAILSTEHNDRALVLLNS